MRKMERWDIFAADVPYEEDPNKSDIHPVLIISDNECLVLKVTSHNGSDKPKPYEYTVMKWKEAGLTKLSFIQCNRFIQLSKDRFTGKYYGRLQMVDIIGLQQMMHYHGLTL